MGAIPRTTPFPPFTQPIAVVASVVLSFPLSLTGGRLLRRLYSDYLYFASANKSAEDFHEKVAESLQLFENCVLDYSLRACVYNNTLNNAMPVRSPTDVRSFASLVLHWVKVIQAPKDRANKHHETALPPFHSSVGAEGCKAAAVLAESWQW